jgi:hypothetical protein
MRNGRASSEKHRLPEKGASGSLTAVGNSEQKVGGM